MASIFNEKIDIPLGEAFNILQDEILSYVTGYNNLVPVIAGAPGIGKSSVYKFIAEKMNRDFYIISLGAIPYEYLSGLPEFTKTLYDGVEVNATEWTLPGVIDTINKKTLEAQKNGKDGLLVILDDIHLMDPAAQKYMFEFFQNKTLQGYKIAEGATLVGAMNDSAAAGAEGFYSAVMDRISLHFVGFDFDFWYTNIGFNLHPIIAAFAKTHETEILGSESKDQVSASPRSWTELSNFYNYLTEVVGYDLHSVEFKTKMNYKAISTVGTKAAKALVEFFNSYIKYDFKKIIDEKQVDYIVPEDSLEAILNSFMIRSAQNKEEVDTIIKIIFNNKSNTIFFSTIVAECASLIHNRKKIKDKKKQKAIEYLKKILVEMDDDDITEALVDSQ